MFWIFSAVSIIVLSGFVLWADANMKAVFRDTDRAQAFMTAEAGGVLPMVFGARAERLIGRHGGAVRTFTNSKTKTASLSVLFAGYHSTADRFKPSLPSILRVRLRQFNRKQDYSSEDGDSIFAKYAIIVNDYVRFGEGTEIFAPSTQWGRTDGRLGA